VADIVDADGWTCPVPLRAETHIVLGHGGGGLLGSELVERLFLPAFGTAEVAAAQRDSVVLEVGGVRLAFTTDSYVVNPLFFPGGCIGDLAVNGTINDLAMSGAAPVALSAGFILEEGLDMAVLDRVARAMGAAARNAKTRLVTGDTKVVERGHGDGLYVNTSGIGLVAADVHIGPERARPGDRVLVSGAIGEHGVAIMSVRSGIEFGTTICSRPCRRSTRCATRPAAGSRPRCARSPPPPGSASCWTRRRCRYRSRWPRPAASWASIRSMWPTRASWSRSSRTHRPRRHLPRCGRTATAPGRRSSAR
jgi:hydrogenase expression/formation protein HypE